MSFLDEKYPTYDILRKCLDAKLKDLTESKKKNKQAQPIKEEELWQKKRETGESLTNVVFWYSCKTFVLLSFR